MQRRQSFLSGAAVLAGAVAMTKVLGALYKIPLGNLLGSQGMAHFYAAYNIYNLLLMLSTAGLPPAASRLVAQAAVVSMLPVMVAEAPALNAVSPSFVSRARPAARRMLASGLI